MYINNNEFSKSQQKAKNEAMHPLINFILGSAAIVACVIMAVRCIH